MLYRKLGKTGENVSVLGFGCMRLPLMPGGDRTKIDEKLATRLIHHAVDNGVNYIDTAYPYHGSGMDKGGESEPFTGRALKGGYRQKVFLATKLPSWLVKTRADMDTLLDEQLKRLQTDYIDFYLVHNINTDVWPRLKESDFPDFLDKALKSGKIRHAGFSFHDKISLFKEAADYYDWSFCQIQYNYMDEEFQAGTEGLRYAAAKDLGIIAMEPLRGGRIADGLPAEVAAVFKSSGKTPAQMALRWVWNHSEVGTLLSGMNSMEQLEENLKTANEAYANSMSQEELQVVDTARDAYRSRIQVDCTACEYCMPCPSGVNIPRCFSSYNNLSMYGREDGYNMFMPKANRASACTECGVCEQHCPQGFAIPELLKKVKEAFGS